MGKLVTFEISEGVVYCPLSLNNDILAKQPSRGGIPGKIEESRVMDILNNIAADTSMLYILDISSTQKMSITDTNKEKLYSLKNAMIYVTETFYSQHFAEKQENLTFTKDEKGYLIYNSNTENKLIEFAKEKLQNKTDMIGTIHAYVYVRFFLLEAERYNHTYEESNLKYLESSNVYVNRYINVKALFLQPDYLYLVINDLMEVIRKGFPDYQDACLLGVSNNGIILSRLLAYQLQLEVKSINHLGPKYCLESNDEVMKDLRNKKFILVNDVICLGSEYRIAKGILNVLGSKLLGAVTIVKIKDVYRTSMENKESCADKTQTDKKGQCQNKHSIKQSDGNLFQVRKNIGNSNCTVCQHKKHRDKIFSLVERINDYDIDGKSMDYQIFIDEEEEDYGDGV